MSTKMASPQQEEVNQDGRRNQSWRRGLRRMLTRKKNPPTDGGESSSAAVEGPTSLSEAKMAMVYALGKYQTLEETRQIVEHFPGSLEAVNCFKQTALHVACLRGAQPDVVAYICLQHPKACSMQDQNGKLPLHYLVTQSKRFFEDVAMFNSWFDDVLEENRQESTTRCIEVYLEMLRTVIKQYTQALGTEDNEEMNPIEVAIVYEAPQTVVCTLQQFSSYMWKEHEAKKRQFAGQGA
jgi:hypothetical protein